MIHYRFYWFRYDVALSFAEEDRAYADRVAALLKQERISVYYDDHERADAWGKDLLVHLEKVYRIKARFCIIFISQYYKDKRWTRQEAEWAQARAFLSRNEAYILPYRLDATEIPAIKESIAYLSPQTHNEKDLVRAVAGKVAQHRKRRRRTGITLMLSLFLLADIGTYAFSGRSTLSARLLELMQLRDRWHFSAVCADGTLSVGRKAGACSGHKGVAAAIDTMLIGESIQDCKRSLIAR